MHTATNKLCMWLGLAGALLFFIGLVIAGFFPPPAPSLGAAEIAAIYQANITNIRIGVLIIMISGVFALAPVPVIAGFVKRIEGSEMPTMTYLVLLGGLTNVLVFIFPGLLFIVTAYRPDRPPEITLLMNDFSWFITVLAWPGAFIQCVATATAILRSPTQTLLPRWLAYFHLWAAVLFLPSSLMPFFKTGPFAWNGLFAFWIPGTLFFAWYIVILVVFLKAIDRDAARLNETPG